MCRHLAYAGPGVVLSRLFHEAPHSLERQTYQAREMTEGHVNADGFAVAWYPPKGAQDGTFLSGEDKEPFLYQSERPAWADPVWRGLARRFVGRIAVMGVRNATDPSTTGLAGVHPFASGRFVFTHNGFVTGFREKFMRRLGQGLSDKRYGERAGPTDTQTLFMVLLDKLDGGAAPQDALAELVQETMALARDAGERAYLNFLLADGERVWATRAATEPQVHSLYVAHAAGSFPGSVVASERLDDDPAWREVPQGSLVVLEPEAEPRFVSVS